MTPTGPPLSERGTLPQFYGALTPALSGLAPDPLTPREREVAMLAATGLTSPEIAERLVLSVRTVEGYLQHAYDKLGIAGRGDLHSVFNTSVVRQDPPHPQSGR